MKKKMKPNQMLAGWAYGNKKLDKRLLEIQKKIWKVKEQLKGK